MYFIYESFIKYTPCKYFLTICGFLFNFIYLFLLNLFRWHWLTKLHRFQGHNSTKHHLHNVLCIRHPKSSLLPSLLIPPCPPPLPLPPPPAIPTLWSMSFFFFVQSLHTHTPHIPNFRSLAPEPTSMGLLRTVLLLQPIRLQGRKSHLFTACFL